MHTERQAAASRAAHRLRRRRWGCRRAPVRAASRDRAAKPQARTRPSCCAGRGERVAASLRTSRASRRQRCCARARGRRSTASVARSTQRWTCRPSLPRPPRIRRRDRRSPQQCAPRGFVGCAASRSQRPPPWSTARMQESLPPRSALPHRCVVIRRVACSPPLARALRRLARSSRPARSMRAAVRSRLPSAASCCSAACAHRLRAAA